MPQTFTTAEIRKWLLLQDSLGDALYHLSAKNINKANYDPEKDEDSLDITDDDE